MSIRDSHQRRSTIAPRLGYWSALMLMASFSVQRGAGQGTISLWLNPNSPQGTIQLNLLLDAPGATLPAALQWTVNYTSPSIVSFAASEGPSASSAGKGVTCSQNQCLLYGLNTGNIPSGVAAVLTFQLAGGASGEIDFQLTNVFAATGDGQPFALNVLDPEVDVLTQIPAFSPDVAANLSMVGAAAQVVAGNDWDTAFTLVNLGAGPADTRMRFLGDDGTPLSLPVSFPQGDRPAAEMAADTVDQTISSGATLVMDSSGPDRQPLQEGSAWLLADGNVKGFGIFSNAAYGWTAAVPLDIAIAPSYVLAFDNTATLATGVAIANLAAQPANIPVILRDETGAQTATDVLSLPAGGHMSFMLSAQYPVTTSGRGTIEIDIPTGGGIAALGMRANGLALTSLPLLAGGSPGGGTIAHYAYNGGFTSTYYLVNTGASAASFTLSFFDEAGNPQSVPLSLPTLRTTAVTAALTQPLGAGAMLEIDTAAQDSQPLIQGSAQLTTGGNIGGFEVFRWTTFGHEASVPIETRTPSSFVLAFDNTNGLTTGLALANAGNQAQNVTVNLRDNSGALLQTASINLAALGHTSFMLPVAYPVTNGISGTVEFVPSPEGRVSVIGVRATNTGNLTTLPVLAR